MRVRWLISGAAAAAAVAVVIATAAADPPPADTNGGATARAYALQITLPSQPPGTQVEVNAPPGDAGFAESYQYPADGSVLSVGAITSTVVASPGTTATASAATDVATLSLFGGEITADSVSARANASASAQSAGGDYDGTGFTNLTVLGQVLPQPTVNERVPLADWGYAILLEQPPSSPAAIGTTQQGYHGFVTALDVHLTADHDGLPAGSEIQIGYAETNAQPARQAETGTATEPTGPGLPEVTTTPSPQKQPKRKTPTKAPEPDIAVPPVIEQIPRVTPKLSAGGYVFPVYGPVSYGDTFGAPRADVSWHHGDDIFGTLGQPVLAVADGTVFSVGPEDIGGLRLWLRDSQGNEFYYAHLSAYSPLAVDGAQVHAGDVLGFMGNTGDARGTPYHLHFEVHPVGLLPLGYDGAVDPTSYLEAWQHQRDLSFASASGWAPGTSFGALSPQPGAILLASTDISSASGLEPGSLARAMSTRLTEGDLSVLGYGAPVQGGRTPAAPPRVAAGDLGRG
jgi:murein DD-endopeptidase MepM/ murein hydrolase activator NlpD